MSDVKDQAVKQPNLTFGEATHLSRLPGEKRKIISTVLKFSIIYLMLGGVVAYYGVGWYGSYFVSIPVAPLVFGMIVWTAPFVSVYSIRGKRRPTAFKISGFIVGAVAFGFAGVASFNYVHWQNCLRTYLCIGRGIDFFNKMSAYALVTAFVLISLAYIGYDGESTKCPFCKSPWARFPDGGKYKCRFCGSAWSPGPKRSFLKLVKRQIRFSRRLLERKNVTSQDSAKNRTEISECQVRMSVP